MGKLKKIGIAFGGMLILFIVMGALSIAFVTNDLPDNVVDSLTDKTIQNEKSLEESTEKDFFEEYWEQHPDEDPCNDPTAKAFGLCE